MTGAARSPSRLPPPAIDVAPVPVAPARRVQFVDASRAVAVLGMLAANLVNVWLRDVPDVLAHNQGDALRAFRFRPRSSSSSSGCRWRSSSPRAAAPAGARKPSAASSR
jgi:hypothetical protein